MTDFDYLFNEELPNPPKRKRNGANWLQQDDLESVANLKASIRHERAAVKREMIAGHQRQALSELVPTLPPPDSELYLVSSGLGGTYRLTDESAKHFELGHFIFHLIDLLGGQDCTFYGSTWTMNREHALSILKALDSGAIKQATVFTDSYFKRREAAVSAMLITGLIERGQRYLAFKNHAKIIALANADESRFVTVFSSANWSAAPRSENIQINTCESVYRWVVQEFFEEMIARAKS